MLDDVSVQVQNELPKSKKNLFFTHSSNNIRNPSVIAASWIRDHRSRPRAIFELIYVHFLEVKVRELVTICREMFQEKPEYL